MYLLAYHLYDLEQLYIGLFATNTKSHDFRQLVVEIQIRIFLSAKLSLGKQNRLTFPFQMPITKG